MLLNRAAAEALWPGEDPVGQQVRFWFAGITDDDPWLEIVGVTGDTRDLGLAMAAPPTVFVPFSQGPPGSPLIALSTAGGDPADLMGPVSGRARSLEPGVVLWDVRTMSDRVRESVAGRWFAVLLTAAFGALALALAGVGIYGVIAYAVRRRTREIGVRLALGATATRVVRLVFREGAGPILLGVAVGLITSLGAAQLLDALLFGVSPVDPWSFGGAVLVLCLVAAAAILIPARRAASVHPMSALRAE
jgi:predicted lysophospholipase L1 biosynthesis ABC-type transport system permease subunit